MKKRMNDSREIWVVEKFENGVWRFWDSRRLREKALEFLTWNRGGEISYRVVRYIPEEPKS